MLTMQSNEVKTHFSGVLREIEQGQEVLVTRHRKVIAKIIPYREDLHDPHEAVAAVRALRTLPLSRAEADAYRRNGQR